MELKLYLIDTFTNEITFGSPATVCPLTEWIDAHTMQNIAKETNHGETIFYKINDTECHIRTFTSNTEIEQCVNATLAAAYIIFENEYKNRSIIRFLTRNNNDMLVTKHNELLSLNMQNVKERQVEIDDKLKKCFDTKPQLIFRNESYYSMIFNNENEIRNLEPNIQAIEKLQAKGVIVSAKGDNVDFVSRLFSPQNGRDESASIGSAYAMLVPYWNKRLEKSDTFSIQLSSRKGFLQCRLKNDRTEISGQCKLFETRIINF